MAAKRRGTYKITNWSQYNESLVQRGSVTFWFSEDVIRQWQHANAQPRRGHPFVYSDTAIECLFVLRELFQLPYRQTEGLGCSLVQLMEIELAIPDYTSLAKRAAKLDIALDVRRHRGAIDVVVDSTGLKVFGEGEWKMRAHGKSKRRTWRKLHLAVNPKTQEIVAETLTENNCDDASQVDPLCDGPGLADSQKSLFHAARAAVVVGPEVVGRLVANRFVATTIVTRLETAKHALRIGLGEWGGGQNLDLASGTIRLPTPDGRFGPDALLRYARETHKPQRRAERFPCQTPVTTLVV